MPENGEKITIHVGVISKKATSHVQHTFLYISLPLFCATTTWNFQKLLSYTFYGGNVICVLVHFFFTTTHFHLALVATSISHFLTAACSSNKKCLLCCLSLASGCIWVSIPVDWVILHWYPCGADRQSVGCTDTWLTKFVGWVDYHIFLRMVLCCTRFEGKRFAMITMV